MSLAYVEYPLQDGYICQWLAAGPQEIAAEPSQSTAADLRRALFSQHYTADSGIRETPVERGPVEAGRFVINDYSGSWTYYRCADDHRIDHSGYYPVCRLLRSWAYVELVSTTTQLADIVLWADGPVDVWAGGAHVWRDADLAARAPIVGKALFKLPLQQGVTPLLIRFEQLGVRHTAHTLALRLTHTGGSDHPPIPMGEEVHVRFPTLMPNVARRNAFERLSADAFMDRDVYHGETPMTLCWPDSPRASCFAHARLQTLENRIYALGDSVGNPGDTLQLSTPLAVPAGPLQTTLMPDADEVYVQHMRIFRSIPFWSMGRQRYCEAPTTDLAGRRDEILLALAHRDDTLYAQIARMARGDWADVDGKRLLPSIERVRGHEDGSHLLLLSLLGMHLRWGDHPRYPHEVRKALEASILGYRYWREDAGNDVMDFSSHANPLVFHACETLAGRLYPARIFGDGRSGKWHQERGSRLAIEWMIRFGAYGAEDWNSPISMEQAVAALTHLCDLAEADQVYELASVVLDKLLFGLALHSHRGIQGGAAHSLGEGMIKSALLIPTAGIAYLLWGMGIVNHHAAGVLSLACSSSYQLPAILQAIAQDAPPELWSREQHAVPGAQAANVVTHKTPETMLSSVQDYRAWQTGESEQVWRATLSAEAIVFTNHPGSSSESDHRLPGYWIGNGSLPRIAQWQDTLVAIYRLPADDPFGFTHAYFPTALFDEHSLRNGWAFARCGDGYIALTSSQQLLMTGEGRYARRELRAYGQTQSWLVQMGRRSRDGDFAAFQAKVLSQPLALNAESVRYTTLSADTLEFSAHGPLLINRQSQSLADFKHYENPYSRTDLPAQVMEIHLGDSGLRLNFTLGNS
ncbi:MAG: hypothetical protein KF893_14110 [Caldilineaceae bacterium]|nr:hypothetical protein [Caldilineaceae bacterium]